MQITGDNFVVNAKSVIRKIMLDGNVHTSVFESVKNFAERSDGDSSAERLDQWIADGLLECTLECLDGDAFGLRKIVSCLEDSEVNKEIQLQRQKLWREMISFLAEMSGDRQQNMQEILDVLISITTQAVWKTKQWSISNKTDGLYSPIQPF